MNDIRIGDGCCNRNFNSRERKLQKIILMEGPDRTGKSNIGAALALDLKIPYFKVSTEAENWKKGKFKQALEFDQTYISEFLVQTRHNVLIDRAYPSEFVYSKVFERETNMDVLKMVDERFARMGTYIIITLRHDYSKAKDELVPADRLQAIHDGYLEFSEWTKCGVIQIYVDGYGDKLQMQIPAIRSELESVGFYNEERTAGMWDFRTMVTLDRNERKLDKIKPMFY